MISSEDAPTSDAMCKAEIRKQLQPAVDSISASAEKANQEISAQYRELYEKCLLNEKLFREPVRNTISSISSFLGFLPKTTSEETEPKIQLWNKTRNKTRF